MEKLKHIVINTPPDEKKYTNPGAGGDGAKIPIRDRIAHYEHLKKLFSNSWAKCEAELALSHSDKRGIYIEFQSEPGYELKKRSLENISAGIRLLNVRKIVSEEGQIEYATLFIPNDKKHVFLKNLMLMLMRIR